MFVRGEQHRAPPRQAEPAILRAGENCWKIVHADRFACIVDGDAYFRRLYQAIEQAEHSVFVLGWDIDSRVELLRNAEGARHPVRFAAFLDDVVRARRGLQVFVLTWDYASVYALERDPLTRLRMGLTSRRIHFRYDDKHPLGASHHQKVVVVDDKVAFCGGLDITTHRWDTPEHVPENPLRTNKTGKVYEPFHDVQAVVSGEAAAALGELARVRWRRVSRRRPPARDPRVASDPWPSDLEPDLEDVEIAIARTQPAFGRVEAVHEVEALYHDSIAAARRTIYVENQYFTSTKLAAALAARLAERDGPEIVVVGPRTCSGWLEHKTMGALRERALHDLVAADHAGKLRLVHPFASRAQACSVFVHSKVMVVDESLLRIGSSNFSNRSLGLDTECDLAIESRGDPRIEAGIARVRARLCAEHLGVSEDAFHAGLAARGSLVATFDALGTEDRGVCAIEVTSAPGEPLVPADLGVDPEGPLRVTRAIDRFLPEILRAQRRSRARFAISAALFLAAALALAALARTPPFDAWLSWERLRHFADSVASHPSVGPAVVGVFVVGAFLSIPVDLMTLAAALLLGGVAGGAYSFVGVLAGAVATYLVGRWIGAPTFDRLTGSELGRLARKLSGRGFVSVALLRLVPVAPATLVNLACGAARIRLGVYVAGTALGSLPAVLALALFGEGLARLLREPSLKRALVLIALALALAWIAWRGRRILATHPDRDGRASDGATFAHD